MLRSEVSGLTVKKGKIFVYNLLAKNYKDAKKQFSKKMIELVSEKSFGDSVEYLYKNLGDFKQMLKTRTEEYKKSKMTFTECGFEKGNIEIKVVFDEGDNVIGYFFVPVKQKKIKFKLPEYGNDISKYSEKEMLLKNGKWSLPGILTLPKGKGPFAILVLVHGSGPNDMDESIGPNKPFKDIAVGLASKGIGVYRYDKRTKVYPNEMAGLDITVWDETIDDAVIAGKMLADVKKIDKNKIFVLGHSLGGMLITRIAEKSDIFAGYIIMAGATRHFADVMIDQYNYIFSLDGEIDENDQKTINGLESEIKKIKALKNGDPKSLKILGIPSSYWIDLKDFKPAESAKKISRPVLVLHGGRDYQVTGKDLKNWELELKNKPDVRFRYYPTLNHFFIHGEGVSQPSEYSIENHVSSEVIEDIVNWLNRVK